MLNYALMKDKDSLFNTPNTFGIFALERMLSWLQDCGGVSFIEKQNKDKAQKSTLRWSLRIYTSPTPKQTAALL